MLASNDGLLGGIDCIILSAFTLSSTLRVKRYLEVLSLNLVMPFFLFFLIVIFSALGRFFCSLLTILMNSFRSLISFGYKVSELDGRYTYHIVMILLI